MIVAAVFAFLARDTLGATSLGLFTEGYEQQLERLEAEPGVRHALQLIGRVAYWR